MEHIISKEFHLEISKRLVYGKSWQAKNPKAILVLVHGMCEHLGSYELFFVPRFLEQDISVIALDQFGHGKTQGKRGVSPGYELHLDAIDKLIQKGQELNGDLPTIVYGHSMGGNVVANYLLTRKTGYDAGILSSPFLELAFKPSAVQLNLARIVNFFLPSVTQNANINIESLARDINAPEIVNKGQDPLMHDRISASFILPFIKQGKWAIDNANLLSKPTLVVHGTEDRLTSYQASQEFCKNSDEKVKLVTFEGGYHELHNDICKDELFKTLIDFINTIKK